MSFFKRKGPSNVDLSGFWTRKVDEVLVGALIKFVANDKLGPKKAKPFYILKIVDPVDGPKSKCTIAVFEEGKPVVERKAKVGEYVGVGANWSINSVIDKVTDIGKVVRMTVTGTAPNPNGGKDMTLIDVEVDDGSEPTPF
jgi:hypothetical protein